MVSVTADMLKSLGSYRLEASYREQYQLTDRQTDLSVSLPLWRLHTLFSQALRTCKGFY